jgi:hypothetical protein
MTPEVLGTEPEDMVHDETGSYHGYVLAEPGPCGATYGAGFAVAVCARPTNHTGPHLDYVNRHSWVD